MFGLAKSTIIGGGQLLALVLVVAYYGAHAVVAYIKTGKYRLPPANSKTLAYITIGLYFLLLAIHAHSGPNWLWFWVCVIAMMLHMALQLVHRTADGSYYVTRFAGAVSCLFAGAICVLSIYLYIA